MIPVATALAGGVALVLLPVLVATIVVIVGGRRARTDTFLLMMAAVTLLPAAWATGVRLELGGCDGCLSGHEKDLMTAVLPSLPLLAAALVLLFLGRSVVLAAGALIAAQVLVGVGVWLPNKATSFLMLLLIAGEVLYLVLSSASRQRMRDISGSNGHPGVDRRLSLEE
jgi:hypothetical protein